MNVSDGRRDGAHATTTKPRKRTLTEARKEQNRLAQRAFRQRQKERLQLENAQRQNRRSPAHNHVLKPQLPRDIEETTLWYGQHSSASPESAIIAPTDPLQPLLDSRSFSQPIPIHPGNYSHDELLSLPSAATSFSSGTNLGIPNNSSACDPLFSQIECMPPDIPGGSGWSSTLPSRDSLGMAVRDSYYPTTFDSLNSASPATSLDAVNLSYDMPQYQLGGDLPMDFSLPPTTQGTTFEAPNPDSRNPDTVDDSQNTSMEILASVSPELVNFVSAGLEAILGRRVRTNLQDGITSFSLPSLHMNRMRFSLNSTLLPYLFNARCLGIKIQDLVNPKCPSPFYRPTTPADDPKALLAAATNPSIPAHLQPTLPQILFPHHPYLDLLPFPVLRMRAITWSAVTPPLFNPRELKKDIFDNGITCWRTGSREGCGQPWDVRSWEIAPWFLKKWRMLIDGEDGEIWKQSVGWQKVRESQLMQWHT